MYNQFPKTKQRQKKKIMIEELMFSQMKENLGQNIGDYV